MLTFQNFLPGQASRSSQIKNPKCIVFLFNSLYHGVEAERDPVIGVGIVAGGTGKKGFF
jgi:hypothetical protein